MAHTYIHTNKGTHVCTVYIGRQGPPPAWPSQGRGAPTSLLNLAHLKETSIAPTHAHTFTLLCRPRDPHRSHRTGHTAALSTASVTEYTCIATGVPDRTLLRQSARRLPAQLDKKGRGVCRGGGGAPVRTCSVTRQVRRLRVGRPPSNDALPARCAQVSRQVLAERAELGHAMCALCTALRHVLNLNYSLCSASAPKI